MADDQARRSDWRIELELALQLQRTGMKAEALQAAIAAAETHEGNGRLWATVIQMAAVVSIDHQWAQFKRAVAGIY